MRLLDKLHYLGRLQPVGEQMLYVAVTANVGWVALLVFAAAAKNLKARERWIGWTFAQRRKRLSLIANNVRYLILPRRNIPNMGSRVLRLTTDRICSDWQRQYGHPLAALETFVDPEQFQGTVYRRVERFSDGLASLACQGHPKMRSNDWFGSARISARSEPIGRVRSATRRSGRAQRAPNATHETLRRSAADEQ